MGHIRGALNKVSGTRIAWTRTRVHSTVVLGHLVRDDDVIPARRYGSIGQTRDTHRGIRIQSGITETLEIISGGTIDALRLVQFEAAWALEFGNLYGRGANKGTLSGSHTGAVEATASRAECDLGPNTATRRCARRASKRFPRLTGLITTGVGGHCCVRDTACRVKRRKEKNERGD